MRSIDYHMHTRFSGDSEADPREHVIQAIKMGLDEICFTDHRDFDYPIDVFDLDVEGYYQTIMALKKEFADKLIAIDPERGTQLANNLECSLMAIPLVAHEALTTAYINDVDGLGVFAQQLFGFGKEGDVFLGISTSGNSKNVLPATVVARALGIKVIGLTGAKGGELAEVADVAVKAPETETYMVQEFHLPIYHCWCLMLEDKFFGEN